MKKQTDLAQIGLVGCIICVLISIIINIFATV